MPSMTFQKKILKNSIHGVCTLTVGLISAFMISGASLEISIDGCKSPNNMLGISIE